MCKGRNLAAFLPLVCLVLLSGCKDERRDAFILRCEKEPEMSGVEKICGCLYDSGKEKLSETEFSFFTSLMGSDDPNGLARAMAGTPEGVIVRANVKKFMSDGSQCFTSP